MNKFDKLFNAFSDYGIILEGLTTLKPIIVYPGRFQPMLPHHAKVFEKLQQKYPDADVYLSTSDKVEPGKSPFTFEEKVRIIEQLYSIPANKVLKVRQLYVGEEYMQFFDKESTYLMLAVGKKDMDEDARFKFDNKEPDTGLNRKKRGEGYTYIQPESAMGSSILPMKDGAYIIIAPTIKEGGEIASASAFRDALRNSKDPKAHLLQAFGKRVEPVADLIISKILS